MSNTYSCPMSQEFYQKFQNSQTLNERMMAKKNILQLLLSKLTPTKEVFGAWKW